MQERDPGVPRQLVVHVAADAQREVDPGRLQARDLAAEQVHGAGSSDAGRAQQLVVALVAAEDGVREVQPDDGDLGERRRTARPRGAAGPWCRPRRPRRSARR